MSSVFRKWTKQRNFCIPLRYINRTFVVNIVITHTFLIYLCGNSLMGSTSKQAPLVSVRLTKCSVYTRWKIVCVNRTRMSIFQYSLCKSFSFVSILLHHYCGDCKPPTVFLSVFMIGIYIQSFVAGLYFFSWFIFSWLIIKDQTELNHKLSIT